MKKSAKRSTGAGRFVLLGGAALAAIVAVAFWPSAEATPTRCEALTTICTSPGGETRKLLAFEELRSIDTTASRDALFALANSTDDKLATMALGTLCRHDSSASRGTIRGVFENPSRSDLARTAALAAHCQLQSKDGKSWSDSKRYIKEKAGQNLQLRGAYGVLKTKFWSGEADDE